MINIGIYGGSFDPIHYGHLFAAEQIREKLDLKRVLFVPVRNQKEKSDTSQSYDKRCELVQAAIKDYFRFKLFHDEITDKKTFSFNTINYVKEVFQKDYVEEFQFYFIIGTDKLYTLPRWYRAKELGSICKFAVAMRGNNYELYKNMTISISKEIGLSIDLINIIESPLSSTMIRNRLKNGETCKYFVPDGALDIIEKERLYIN